MIINRIWAMPNKWTFKIKPIKELLDRYMIDDTVWFDPFAGMNSPAQYRNDHRWEMDTDYHMDALDFVLELQSHFMEFDGCLFDPPYSIHEVKRHYDSLGRKYDFKNDPTCSFKQVRDIAAKIIKPGGLVIYFGWNTNAFGKKRGFEILEILITPHGGNRNDTLVTVERKL